MQANTAAHELGHCIGLPHDGNEDAKACPKSGFLMEPVLCSNCQNTPKISFSPCSLSLLRNIFDSNEYRCLNEDPFQPIRCGNGVIDTNEGEECDSEMQCCNRKTCRFQPDGFDCKVKQGNRGVCGNRGTCIQTCGNGRLDPNEDCDPFAKGSPSDSCCDAKTCSFLSSGISCNNGGQCNGIGQCMRGAIGISPVPEVQVETIVPLYKYRVYVVSPREKDTRFFYSVDGSTPTESSPRSRSIEESIEISLDQILEHEAKFATKFEGLTFQNPMQPDRHGDLNLTLRLKAFRNQHLSSPTFSSFLQFNTNANGKLRVLEATDSATQATITIAVILAIVLLIIITCAICVCLKWKRLHYVVGIEIFRLFFRRLSKKSKETDISPRPENAPQAVPETVVRRTSIRPSARPRRHSSIKSLTIPSPMSPSALDSHQILTIYANANTPPSRSTLTTAGQPSTWSRQPSPPLDSVTEETGSSMKTIDISPLNSDPTESQLQSPCITETITLSPTLIHSDAGSVVGHPTSSVISEHEE
jgi:hypothetical protein